MERGPCRVLCLRPYDGDRPGWMALKLWSPSFLSWKMSLVRVLSAEHGQPCHLQTMGTERC